MAKLPARIWGLALFGALALAARGDDLPPINSPASQAWFEGKFVWADLFTADPATASQFYTSLFGWQAQTITRTSSSGATHTYIVLSNEGRPVAGIALRPAKMADQVHGRWVGYVSVPDVQQALSAAETGGGRVLFSAKNLPLRGTQAIFVDPDGAELGVVHSSSGDPDEFEPDPGDWIWSELFAKDPAKAAAYYRSVAGYDTQPDTRADRAGSFVLVSGGYSRASVSPVPDRPNAKPVWLYFVRVASVQDTVAKATALGGRVLRPPSDVPTEYWRAIIADPTGGVIGVIQLDEQAAEAKQP